jgi:dTDP-4-amino-4,6-dideoxygalactose transaminase
MSLELAALCWPIVSEQAIARVGELLRSGNTSFDEGLCRAFEAELCRYFQVRRALVTCNGTSAIFSAFHAAGLEPGDEVIAPPLTHWASVAPAAYLGCDLRYADLEPDSLGLSCDAVRRKITPRTRAVVVCHLYGNPVDVAALRTLCDEYGLLLFEDISHATGATLHGRPLGSFGHVSAFSMQAAKLISAGEGGVLLTNDDNLYERAMVLGHPKRTIDTGGSQRVIRVTRGFKFRPSTVTLVLAEDSFRQLPEILDVRNRMADALRERLAGRAGIAFPRTIPGAERVYWEQELLLNDPRWRPENAVHACRQAGLPAAPLKFEFLPEVPWLSNGEEAAWPHAERHRQSLLILPAFNQPDTALLDRYVEALTSGH